jgi:hypothetical protein
VEAVRETEEEGVTMEGVCSRCHRKLAEDELVTLVFRGRACGGASAVVYDDNAPILMFCSRCVPTGAAVDSPDVVAALLEEEEGMAGPRVTLGSAEARAALSRWHSEWEEPAEAADDVEEDHDYDPIDLDEFRRMDEHDR